MKALFSAIAQRLTQGEDVVLCSVIASSGSTPRGAGAKMAVFQDGSIKGTIGGGNVEHISRKMAADVFQTKESYVKGFILQPNDVADLGMICGGNVTVYFQYFSAQDVQLKAMMERIVALLEQNSDAWLITCIREGAVREMAIYDTELGLQYAKEVTMEILQPLLKNQAVLVKGDPGYYVEPISQSAIVYIFGGGHVSQELVPAIARVGFRPVVYEDRPDFTDIALFDGAIGTVLGDFKNFEANITVKPSDYIIIVTRGHQADYDVLEQALRTPVSYVGCIGSRHKQAAIHEKLRAAGIGDHDIARIHNPIGLPILAETPAEIAVSITAELIQHRASHR